MGSGVGDAEKRILAASPGEAQGAEGRPPQSWDHTPLAQSARSRRALCPECAPLGGTKRTPAGSADDGRPSHPWFIGTPGRTRTCAPRLRRPENGRDPSQPVVIAEGEIADHDASQPVAPLPEPSVPNPRAGLLSDLARRCAEAAAAGDLETARFCHRAMAELLEADEPTRVVDLARARARRSS